MDFSTPFTYIIVQSAHIWKLEGFNRSPHFFLYFLHSSSLTGYFRISNAGVQTAELEQAAL